MPGDLRVLAATLILTTACCAVPQRDVKVLEIPGARVVTYPTELRGTYVPNHESRLKFCAEPAPDVGLESVQKMTLGLKEALANADGSVSSELATKITALAGRTELVVLAREMLYRACELSINNEADPAQAMAMYSKVVELVGKLGTAEQDSAVAAKKRAEAEQIRATAEVIRLTQ